MSRIAFPLLVASLIAFPFALLGEDPKPVTQDKEEAKEQPKELTELPRKNKVTWNIQALEDRFKVLRVGYNPDVQCVGWLVETKKEGMINPLDLTSYFFDEDGVRVSYVLMQIDGGIRDWQTYTPFDTGVRGFLRNLLGLSTHQQLINEVDPLIPLYHLSKLKKAERIWLRLYIPIDMTWERVRTVMVGSEELPTMEK